MNESPDIISPDVIKDAAEALKPISDRGITVMQGWYDKDIKACHVTLWDLGEDERFYSDDEPEGAIFSLNVTVFSREDEVELTREIRKLMKKREFVFDTRAGDETQPEDGVYAKTQRFLKYYDYESEE